MCTVWLMALHGLALKCGITIFCVVMVFVVMSTVAGFCLGIFTQEFIFWSSCEWSWLVHLG